MAFNNTKEMILGELGVLACVANRADCENGPCPTLFDSLTFAVYLTH